MSDTVLTGHVLPAAFRHGFTTRLWGDARRDRREDARRLLQEDAGAAALARVRQVHGAKILRIQTREDADAAATEEADGLCTDVPGLALAVSVADCVPILLADARSGACAAVHAGWRGTVAGVVPAAIHALATYYGSRPADVRAVLGVAIGPCCFEVGPEVAAAMQDLFPALDGAVIEEPGRKPYVDLRAAQRHQMETAGIGADAIEALPGCTRCDPRQRFFSYRRDGAATGHQAAFIVRCL
jgi:YfiH family protein